MTWINSAEVDFRAVKRLRADKRHLPRRLAADQLWSQAQNTQQKRRLPA
jgi:hypothetical protein